MGDALAAMRRNSLMRQVSPVPAELPALTGLGKERPMYVIREKFFRLGEDSEIFDESGRPVLHVDGKVMSLHSRLVLRDPQGQEVAQVSRKLAALRPTY